MQFLLIQSQISLWYLRLWNIALRNFLLSYLITLILPKHFGPFWYFLNTQPSLSIIKSFYCPLPWNTHSYLSHFCSNVIAPERWHIIPRYSITYQVNSSLFISLHNRLVFLLHPYCWKYISLICILLNWLSLSLIIPFKKNNIF